MNSPVLNINSDDICIARILESRNSAVPETQPLLIRQPNSSRSHASSHNIPSGVVFSRGDISSQRSLSSISSGRRCIRTVRRPAAELTLFPGCSPYIESSSQSESLTSNHPIAVIGCARKGVSIIISSQPLFFRLFFPGVLGVDWIVQAHHTRAASPLRAARARGISQDDPINTQHPRKK